MTNKAFVKYSLIIFTFVLSSCFSNDIEIIPKQEFITILTELHIADAILTEKSLYDRKLKDSTKSYYNYILIKHNMSRERFDNNLIYYAQDLEDFTLMYNEVIANIKLKLGGFKRRKSLFNLPLIVIDSINLATKYKKPKSIKRNLWTKKKEWYLPKDGRLNTIEFEKAIYGQSKFELVADIVIFTDDKTVKPTMQIDILYKDKTHDIVKDTTLVKDGKWHTYKLIAETDRLKTPKKITCKIVNHDKGSKRKHLEVNNIFLTKHLIKRTKELPEEMLFKDKKINPKQIK